MANPYDTLGRDFEERVLGGERASLSQPQTTLSDRLTSYAFHVQENAKTTGEALLVSDLLDAAKVLRTPPAAPAEEVWRPIETAPKGKKIIAGYRNEAGMWRTIMARYYHAGTLDSSDFDEGGDEYAPEGWYEEGEATTYCENLQPTEKIPTHWMTLPTPPREGQTEDGR